MAQKKKIFFTYSENENDIKQFSNLCLHFSVLQDKAELWYKAKLKGGDSIQEEIEKQFSESDIFLHLLSVHYSSDEACRKQFNSSVSGKKIIIPVLLSSFDWQSDKDFSQVEAEILPPDKIPVDLHQNFNEVCTEIVQNVRHAVYGEKAVAKASNSRPFYWILSAIVLIIGVLTAISVNNSFADWKITTIVFLMFVTIDLLILRKLLFPTNISSLKL